MRIRQLSIYISLIFGFLFLQQCKNDDSDIIDEGTPVSPVNYDLEAMPYAKLSEYQFFEGAMKDLNPVYGVLPYAPISELFTDYAEKKRFIWMPSNAMAQYNSDHEIPEFPVGTILIKNFYYDQFSPNNSEHIIETRLMIRKASGWIFADYIWNENQSEAEFDLDGSFQDIEFQHNGNNYQTSYRIPSETECHSCHKINEQNSPIGVKPQSLNSSISFDGIQQNQLAKWKEFGYLESYPSSIETVVDWEDPNENMDERIRSYLDINCAHCHTDGAHCDYTSMRFAYHESGLDEALGICVSSDGSIPQYNLIIEAGNANRSALSYRMHSLNPAEMMPLFGRTLEHQEATELIDQWINSLTQDCF